MSWSYDVTKFDDQTAGEYTGSTVGVRYQMRFLIQDNQTTRQLMQDEELDWLQTRESNVYMMSAAACDSLVARMGSVKFKKISELSIGYNSDFYRRLAMELRARGAFNQVPYAGGISLADKLAQEADPDWVAPKIAIGLGQNPEAPQPVSGPQGPLVRD